MDQSSAYIIADLYMGEGFYFVRNIHFLCVLKIRINFNFKVKCDLVWYMPKSVAGSFPLKLRIAEMRPQLIRQLPKTARDGRPDYTDSIFNYIENDMFAETHTHTSSSDNYTNVLLQIKTVISLSIFFLGLPSVGLHIKKKTL